MISLARHLEKYLELRHRLGFKLRDATFELRKFVRFAQKARAPFVTTKLALDWATQPTGCQPARYGNRLGMVRRFAEHLCAVDPRTKFLLRVCSLIATTAKLPTSIVTSRCLS
jgi:integrase/recombinase XerD